MFKRTLLITLLIGMFYFVGYYYPTKFSKSLSIDYKNLATDLKISSSENLISYYSLSNIKIENPKYLDVVEDSLNNVENLSLNLERLENNLKSKKYLLKPKIKKELESKINSLKEIENSKKEILTRYKELSPILLEVLSYNPELDKNLLNKSHSAQIAEGISQISNKYKNPEIFLSTIKSANNVSSETTKRSFYKEYNELKKSLDNEAKIILNENLLQGALSKQKGINEDLENLINNIQ